MPRASLTLQGASLSLKADTAKSALATELQLPDTDIDAAVEALFVKKKPFVLLEDVELSVAAESYARLKSLGIDSEVSVLPEQGVDGTGKNYRVPALAACGVALAVCLGYFFYNHTATPNQVSPIITTSAAALPGVQEYQMPAELTVYQRWRNRLNTIETLKDGLAWENNNYPTGELIVPVEDPFINTIASNYATQLTIQRRDPVDQSLQFEHGLKSLDASLSKIDNLVVPLERIYATLDLATIYFQLKRHDEADSALQLAQRLIDDEGFDQISENIIAQMAFAEHQHQRGQLQSRDDYITSAIDSASQETSSAHLQEWAAAYIATAQAKMGLFTDAHSSLRRITTEHITDSAMEDVSRYAAIKNNETDKESYSLY